MELWRLVSSTARRAIAWAQEAEADGWHGIGVTDSQNLAGDSWVALTAMATATNTLKLGTGVTNPVTRHPAVTATAAMSLGIIAGDRVTIGIGRGDSALAHLGRAPAPVAALEHYLTTMRSYLRGEPVAFDDLGFSELTAPDVSTLGLADTPKHSRVVWKKDDDPVVSVEVAATGPKVIAAAARSADRIIFALGASPERLTWGIETARAARVEAGLDPDEIEFGAYLNVVPSDDLDVARSLIAGSLGTFARFANMHGTVQGPVDESQRRVLEELNSNYDMRKHTKAASAQAQTLTPEFIDHYGIVGSPGRCVARMQEIEDLGIGKAFIIGPSAGSDPADARASKKLTVDEVLPAFAN